MNQEKNGKDTQRFRRRCHQRIHDEEGARLESNRENRRQEAKRYPTKMEDLKLVPMNHHRCQKHHTPEKVLLTAWVLRHAQLGHPLHIES